ncbi:MAG: 2-oxoisovalerate dehydrogenase [Chloroflexota bacterium]|nr:2-oxoisovalerate dehydrogenase [Chloroflexota bacterium]
MTSVKSEIIFEVSQDEVDGGYSASAVGYGIHAQGETLEEVRANVRDAVECYFDETMERPGLIRLHYVRDEVLAL